MEEESRLVEALVEETRRSMVLFEEIEKTRNLILDVVRTFVNHPRVGYAWRTLFDEQILGDIEKIRMGNYLTEEMNDGEEDGSGTESGSTSEEPEGSKESVK